MSDNDWHPFLKGERSIIKAAEISSMTRDKGERLHSTVRLNQFTLRFEDAALEKVYQAGLHPRKKALWLRSLLPAAGSQLLFALADGLDFPLDNLLVTVPTRVLIAMLQLAMWLLVRWDLVRAKEETMLVVSVISGFPTLVLYVLQRPRLCQWDALFVTFGLSFYTIPKITPLGYMASCYGSWATAIVYTILALVVRPPRRRVEVLLAIAFLVPMVWVFNTIAYYSEYNARERFALRRRLRRESITLAVACTSTLGDALLHGGEDDGWLLLQTLSLRGLVAATTHQTTSFGLAIILWGAFTLGGWTSLPTALKFVDEATGWAWFSHCAGVTVFLVVVTRHLRWLVVVPLGGACVLYVLTLAMPASWIIVSAHSVGYGLLLASVVLAMGVFGWFVCAWRELVGFLTRSCFLYPQLQAGMAQEYPLLVRIVSESTAGFDPEILSARRQTATAIEATGTGEHGTLERALMPMQEKAHGDWTDGPVPMDTGKESVDEEVEKAMPVTRTDAVNASPLDACKKAKMVSVLPSFTPGKCFFCAKNDAEHFVPACSLWGKWTHWRMKQELATSSGLVASHKGLATRATSVNMCTSYYDLKSENLHLQARLHEEQARLRAVLTQVKAWKARATTEAMENARLVMEVHAMKDKHAAKVRDDEAKGRERLEAMQTEVNRALHDEKRRRKESEWTVSTAHQQQLEARDRLIQTLQAQAETAENEVRKVQLQLKQSEAKAIKWKRKANARSAMPQDHGHLRNTAVDHVTLENELGSLKSTALQTLLPSGRLPYAQSLEIEGLRESSRHATATVDYSKRLHAFE